MKYCCFRFQEWVEESLLHKETKDENGEELRYFISVQNQLNEDIHCHARIFNCPFCGTKLKDK